jgi:hypothetical protein
MPAATGQLTKTPAQPHAQWRSDLGEMLREFVVYRELLYQMTRRDLLLRYKQTIMGIGWAVLMPLTNTAVFSVIFMRVVALDVGVPYPLFAYTGLAAWNFFASSTRFAVNSLTSNPQLVSKVYFPREVFPFSAVIVSLADFCVSGVVIAAPRRREPVLPRREVLVRGRHLDLDVRDVGGLPGRQGRRQARRADRCEPHHDHPRRVPRSAVVQPPSRPGAVRGDGGLRGRLLRVGVVRLPPGGVQLR